MIRKLLIAVSVFGVLLACEETFVPPGLYGYQVERLLASDTTKTWLVASWEIDGVVQPNTACADSIWVHFQYTGTSRLLNVYELRKQPDCYLYDTTYYGVMQASVAADTRIPAFTDSLVFEDGELSYLLLDEITSVRAVWRRQVGAAVHTYRLVPVCPPVYPYYVAVTSMQASNLRLFPDDTGTQPLVIGARDSARINELSIRVVMSTGRVSEYPVTLPSAVVRACGDPQIPNERFLKTIRVLTNKDFSASHLRGAEMTDLMRVYFNRILRQGDANLAQPISTYSIADSVVLGETNHTFMLTKSPTLNDTVSLTFQYIFTNGDTVKVQNPGVRVW